MTSISDAQAVVLAFVDALNNENFDEARQYVSDDLSFVGVLGSRSGAEAYFQDMKRMKLKYAVHKTFVDSQDVCLWYDVTMGNVTVLTCGWYHVEQGKIAWFKVVFDPRPALQAS